MKLTQHPLSAAYPAMSLPSLLIQPKPLTAAQRTARILRDNTNSPFCTPIPKAGDIKTKRATGAFASV